MAFTKADKEFLELKIKNVAGDVAKKVVEDLPCEIIRAKVNDHEATLHNGLEDDMKEVKEAVTKHVQWHDKEATEKKRGRKTFWRGFLIAGLTLVVGYIFKDVIPKLFGG